MKLTSIGNKIKGNPTMTEGTVYSILVICGISHFLNDMIQSIIPSIYPILKAKFGFSFAQIGLITLVFQMTSSILQPFTGLYADKHPRPYALSIGMCFTLTGLIVLAFAEYYWAILIAVSIVGFGSSVFHPTASRVTQLASGGKKSLAQSIFQYCKRTLYHAPSLIIINAASKAAKAKHDMECWPKGSTIIAASSGPRADPPLPPT